jgi:putative heme-binding domain-containing protein
VQGISGCRQEREPCDHPASNPKLETRKPPRDSRRRIDTRGIPPHHAKTPDWISMRPFHWICCSATLLAAGLWAQTVQNQALTAGGVPMRANIPQTNPFSSEADIQQGAALFQTHCAVCHGANGEGGRGIDLTAGLYRRGGKDADLYTSIRFGISGTDMAPVRVTDEEVWKLVGFVKQLGSQGLKEKAPGDPVAGRMVYQAAGCALCHTIGKEGGTLGPELTDVGRRRGLKFLAESLAKPEADVPVNYRAVEIVPKSGPPVTGIRLNRDDLSIQVRDTADNFRSFLMENVREIRYDKPSLMPSFAALNQKDFNDVVAYLNSLKGEQ